MRDVGPRGEDSDVAGCTGPVEEMDAEIRLTVKVGSVQYATPALTLWC